MHIHIYIYISVQLKKYRSKWAAKTWYKRQRIVNNNNWTLSDKHSDDYVTFTDMDMWHYATKYKVLLMDIPQDTVSKINDDTVHEVLAYFLRAVRIFMEIPHCTQVFIGLGQPFPLTVIPSSSSLYTFTSEIEFTL